MTDQIQSREKAKFSKNFLLMTLNSGISRTGTSGFQLAILWIALLITKSTVLTGFADGMSALPLVFSFIFGAVVDRLASKRTMGIFISVLRVISIFALFVAVEKANLILEVFSIYSVAFVIGMTTDILNSIRSSWSKQFLKEEQYQPGVSILQSISAVAEALGYGFSGVLIVLGLNYAIYGFALIFAVSIVPLFLIRGENTSKTATERDLKSSVSEGMRFIFGDKRLTALIIIVMAINLTMGTFGIFVVDLVEVHFRLSAIYYTFLAMTASIGIILGAVLGSRVRGKVGYYVTGTIFPIAMILIIIGNIPSIYPDYGLVLGIGILIGVVNVVIEIAIIRIVNQEMMGRISGTINTFGMSIMFISGAIGGILIDIFTLRGAFIFIGITLGMVSFITILFREFFIMAV